MVNKLLRLLLILVVISLVVLLGCSTWSEPPPQVILEMTMYPVDGSDNDHILEYHRDGVVIAREILKKDGKRYPLTQRSTGKSE